MLLSRHLELDAAVPCPEPMVEPRKSEICRVEVAVNELLFSPEGSSGLSEPQLEVCRACELKFALNLDFAAAHGRAGSTGHSFSPPRLPRARGSFPAERTNGCFCIACFLVLQIDLVLGGDFCSFRPMPPYAHPSLHSCARGRRASDPRTPVDVGRRRAQRRAGQPLSCPRAWSPYPRLPAAAAVGPCGFRRLWPATPPDRGGF